MLDEQFPLVRLVDAPDHAATILFDFNDGLSQVQHEGFTLGQVVPKTSSSGVGVEYEDRVIRFKFTVNADENTARMTAAQLAKELLRDPAGLWLMFRFSADSRAEWYKIVQTLPGDLSYDTVRVELVKNRWVVSVAMIAEPASRGELEVLGPFTLSPDPEDGWLELDAVKGDFPTPLSFYDTDAYYPFGLVAVSPIPAPFKQAEDCTLGFDTATVIPGTASTAYYAGLSGGSPGTGGAANAAITSFNLYPGLYPRVTWETTHADMTDAQRRFVARNPVRVVAAVRGFGESEFTIQAHVTDGQSGAKVKLEAGNGVRYLVDLGVFHLGNSAVGDYPSAELRSVQVNASRDAGPSTAYLGWDFLLLVPTGQMMWWATAEVVGESTHTFVDADGRHLQVLEATGGPDPEDIAIYTSRPLPPIVGGKVAATPRQENHLLWQPGAGKFNPSARVDLTYTSELYIKYRPLWLYGAAE